jgi:hypothetical protein
MRIIAFIEREDLIKKILKHVGLWEVKTRPPPRAHAPLGNPHIDYADNQILYSSDYCDPDYSLDEYI